MQNDMQAVQQDWEQLQQAVKNNPSGTPKPGFTASEISAALQSAQNAEDRAGGVWQSASQAAVQYDQEAVALKQEADALPASIHCN